MGYWPTRRVWTSSVEALRATTAGLLQGVFGQSTNNAGVVGESQNLHGIFGVCHNPNGAGVFGTNDTGFCNKR